MVDTLDIDALGTLIAISECGSYAAAAARVHRTQAAVSLQMKKLEETVGKPLFKRQGRRNLLTNDGRLLVSHAQRMLTLQHEALSQIRAPELSGLVRIGIPDSYVPALLAGALTSFRAIHPTVDVIVRGGSTPEIRDRLRRGELDVGIWSELPGSEKGTVLLNDRLVWVTSKNHGTHLLDPVPLALYPEPSLLNLWAMDALKAWPRPNRLVFSSTNLLSLQEAVASGFAVAAMMRSSNTQEFLELSSGDGYPNMPVVSVTLNLAAGARTPAGLSLAEHFAKTLPASGPPATR